MQSSFEDMRKEHAKAAEKRDGVVTATAAFQIKGGETKVSSTVASKDKSGKSLAKSQAQAFATTDAAKKKKSNKSVQARASIILDTDEDSSEDDDTDSDDDNHSKHQDLRQDSSNGMGPKGESIDGGLKLQDGLLHLMSAFSPECDDNDTTERIVKTMYRLHRVERIGMFLCDWRRKQLILSIAREGGTRGIRIPMKGIAGHVATTGRVVNVLDAQKEPRFDSTMDKKTGFRTKTILCVPIRSHIFLNEDSKSLNYKKKLVLGVIQIINKKSGRVFKHRDVQLLITVAEMLGHNLDRKQAALLRNHERMTAGLGQQTLISEIRHKFNIRIETCEKILSKWNKKAKQKLRVEVQLFHGSIPLCDAVSTNLIQTSGPNRNVPNGPLAVYVSAKKRAKSGGGGSGGSSSSSSESKNGEEEEEELKQERHQHGDLTSDRLPDGLKLIKKPGAYDYDIRQTIECGLHVYNIPAAAIVMVTLWEGKGRSNPRGWAGMKLFGYDRNLAHGSHDLKLCPYTVPINPSSTTTDGSRLRNQVVSSIRISFDPSLPEDCKYNDDTPIEDQEMSRRTSMDVIIKDTSKPSQAEFFVVKSHLAQLATKDPLYILSKKDKNLLWVFRDYISNNDTLLPKFLRSINWGDRQMVQDAYRAMYAWEQPSPIVALTMLNDHFPDPKVRGYAALCLERMGDETLSQYMLQLTQTLKHEPFHGKVQ